MTAKYKVNLGMKLPRKLQSQSKYINLIKIHYQFQCRNKYMYFCMKFIQKKNSHNIRDSEHVWNKLNITSNFTYKHGIY